MNSKHWSYVLILFLFLLCLPFSTYAEQSVAPTNTDYYYVKNGNLYIQYPTYASLISSKPHAYMEEGVYYTRKQENKELNFYSNYPSHKDYVVTYDMPYTTMNLNQGSLLTAGNIDNAILSQSLYSPLVGWGFAFKEAEKEFKVNALYIASHAALESSWGNSQIAKDKRNLFGLKAYDVCPYECATSFSSFEDSILYNARYVKNAYLRPNGQWYHGSTLKGMNVSYASDIGWGDKIASIMERFHPYNDYGSFFNRTANNQLLVKRMDGEKVIGPSFQFLEDGRFAKLYHSFLYDTHTEQQIAPVNTNNVPYLKDENIYDYNYTSSIQFRSIVPTSTSVYANASATSGVVSSLPKNAIFKVQETSNGFYKLRLQNKSFGWVKAGDTKVQN